MIPDDVFADVLFEHLDMAYLEEWAVTLEIRDLLQRIQDEAID